MVTEVKKHLHNRINRKELKQRLRENPEPRITLSYYKYVQLGDPQRFRDELYEMYQNLGVWGRIYVAREGVNAQISVPEKNMDAFREAMNSYPFFVGMRHNIAVDDHGKSFFTLTIKVREKIVADGIDDPDFNPSNTGTHLNAQHWNALSADPEVVVVDMRNHYESEVGHFKGAITPNVATFREELPLVADMLSQNKDKKILMYCTGGIRCEKASAYLRHRGFKNVFQLEGGIIEYARQVENLGLENRFLGKNFVFDERLGERISNEVIAHCHQCGALCDAHTNCANDHCHILFIQCDACKTTYAGACSEKCRDFSALPEDERKELGKTLEFNGSRFGKGIYKAFKRGDSPLV
ncbi:MAG: rhodanese-related sulfurtransferase [Saprospiraceae bacterium]|nr:rhodanese-related sulfurtransferase [Saprospiraceae bacterium]